jgi:phytoene desaturase
VRVAIVGAGFGGLSAACHLAGKGHSVTVLEAADRPGGRAGAWESQGYRFDTGPVVLTMEPYLRSVFEAAGETLEDHVDLLPLDPMYRATFADGSAIHIRRGRDAMADELRDTCGPKAADSFADFTGWLADLAAVEVPAFIDRNFEGVTSMARPPGPLAHLLRLRALSRFDAVVRSHFDDERLRRLFSFQALYAGMSPMKALAAFAVITWMDTVEGVWYARGGLAAVAEGLARAAEKAGAELRLSSPVEQVVSTGGRVTGVRLAGGEVVGADAVVLNADLPGAYSLLPGLDPPRMLRRGRYSPSCLVWLAGVKGDLPAGADHHNIHFGEDWDEAFVDLLERGTPMRDPSLLVSVGSHTDPDLAPEGSHSLYCLEPLPNLRDATVPLRTDELTEALRRRLIARGYPVSEDDVVVERRTGPTEWQEAGLAYGTPFSLAHRFFQSGPFRPSNVERRLPGTFFVGSGTVPGVGVPMVLLSGRLAAERVEQYSRR